MEATNFDEEDFVDVRRWMPRDPAAVGKMKRMSLVDFIVQQDGFPAAVRGVVEKAISRGRCVCGCTVANCTSQRSPIDCIHRS